MSADEGEQEVPEILDPRQLVILSGEEAEVDFEYSLGVLTSPEPALSLLFGGNWRSWRPSFGCRTCGCLA